MSREARLLFPPRARGDRLPYVVNLHVWLPRLLRTNGITLGRRIMIAAHSCPARLLAHEYRHVEQWAHYGVFGFLRRYLWYAIRYGRRNPLEEDARAFGAMHAHEFPVIGAGR